MSNVTELKPRILAPVFDAMPSELKDDRRWVMWKAVRNHDGRVAKRPFRPDGKAARVNDAGSGSSFTACVNGYMADPGQWSGIGYLLTGSDREITVLDLDKCVDSQGHLEAWAQSIVDASNTYAELSPSGKGVRVITFGDAGAFINADRGLEVYTQQSSRFLTITGRVLDGNDWQGVNRILEPALLSELDTHRPPVRTGEHVPDPVSDSPEHIERVLTDLVQPGSDFEGYEAWLTLGMALHHQFNGSPEGLDMWHRVSSNLHEYQPDELDLKWDSFGRGGGRPVTLRTLFAEAKDHGIPLRERVQMSADEFPDLDEEDEPAPEDQTDDHGEYVPPRPRMLDREISFLSTAISEMKTRLDKVPQLEDPERPGPALRKALEYALEHLGDHRAAYFAAEGSQRCVALAKRVAENVGGDSRDLIWTAAVGARDRKLDAMTLQPDAPELVERQDDRPRRKVGGRFDLITSASLRERDAAVYVVEDLLEFGTRSYLLASPNTGKSALALEIAACVATGEALAGHHEVAQGPVVYWAAEAPRSIERRMDALREAGRLPEEAPLVVPRNLQVDLLSPVETILAELTDLWHVVRGLYGRFPVMLVIDTLSDAAPSNDESTGPTKLIWANLKEVTKRLALAHIMVVHHLGKDATRGGRGSMAGNGSTDVELTLTETNGTVEVRRTKDRDGEKDKLLFSFHVAAAPTGKHLRRKNGDLVAEDAGLLQWGITEGVDPADPVTGLTPRAAALWRLILDRIEGHTPNGVGGYPGVIFGDLRDDWWGRVSLAEGLAAGKTEAASIRSALRRAKAELEKAELAKWTAPGGGRGGVASLTVLAKGEPFVAPPGGGN